MPAADEQTVLVQTSYGLVPIGWVQSALRVLDDAPNQREGNRLMAAALRPLGVTPAQAEVLQVLADRQPLTLTGLGELLVCESGTNPSRLIDRLVTAGLVRRAESGQDRRQVELSLTSAGRGKARQIDGIKNQMYQLMDGAGADYDIQQVLGYLRALVQGRPSGLAIDRRTGRQPHTS